MQPKTLENLSYGLILLQEIAQGYDTGVYRRRAIGILSCFPNLRRDLMHWVNRACTTTQFIQKVEAFIVQTP